MVLGLSFTTSSFSSCVNLRRRDPLKAMVVDNFCNTWWHWCALSCSTSFKTIAKVPEKREFKARNRIHTPIKIQYHKKCSSGTFFLWASFLQKILSRIFFFSFLEFDLFVASQSWIWIFLWFNFERFWAVVFLSMQYACTLASFHLIPCGEILGVCYLAPSLSIAL